MFFAVFMALFCDCLEFPSVNLPKFSQHIAFSGMQILNTKKVGFVKAVFSTFSNLSFAAAKIFINSLPNFTEFHRRKRKEIHRQFCLLCSC